MRRRVDGWEETEKEDEEEGVEAPSGHMAGPHDQVGAMGEAVKLEPYPESCKLLGELAEEGRG